MRANLIGAAAVSALAGIGAASAYASSAHTAECVPKQIMVHGNRGYVACGPASIVVHLNGKTFTVRGGTCFTSPGNFKLNLDVGTIVVTPSGKRVNTGTPTATMAISISPPGEAPIAGLDLFVAGRAYHAPLTLHGHVPYSGTFAGKDLLTSSHPAITGTWTCGGQLIKQNG